MLISPLVSDDFFNEAPCRMFRELSAPRLTGGADPAGLRCLAVCVTNSETGRRFMAGTGGFRAHHKYLLAAIGVIAVLAFLYNLGVLDIWAVYQTAK
ncbi:hypothetical protein [Afipia birgiae]|jgi:hypothetical protein|uniref:hypothetical protein n=1 Tax=Afipia birgiae TaxID=151414 RepID=UPI0003671CD2|nr:hypothetical protein [Afipia birgiae]MBX9820818.1 hypothetical protein [Afipia birgiae]